MKNIQFLFLVFCFFALAGKAASVNPEIAKQVAVNFYFEQINKIKTVPLSDIKIDTIYVQTIENDTIWYGINFEGEGWVIVSAINTVHPIIGYSFEGKYTVPEKNANYSLWFKNCQDQIQYSKNNKATEKVNKEWDRLLNAPSNSKKKSEKKVGVLPMVQTKWDQGKYYNAACPVDAAGPGGHALTGCVPTAMGQLLYYYKFPKNGTGSYSYTSEEGYGVLSADYENTTYDWDAMSLSLTKWNPAVAQLIYHLGVSCDVHYGPNGTGMRNHSAAKSLRNYFKYSPNTQYVYKDSTTMKWDSLIIANLDQKKPLYYAGWTENLADFSGHAFVCDRYQDSTYFHFNWGWGGSYDGYFYVDQLTPGGSNFNYHQELIVDIFPDTNLYTYPEYCLGLKEISSTSGTISDASGPSLYKNNSDCQWLIKPSCETPFKLTFTKFDIASGDTVFVYDGISESASKLGQYTALNPPSLTVALSPTNAQCYVRFLTNDSITADGFSLKFDKVTSAVVINSSAPNGVISDGSGTCDYDISTTRIWNINASQKNTYTINFSEFDFADSSDYLQIANIATTHDELFTSQNIPNESIVIASATSGIRIKFFSNNDSVAGGFTLNYDASFVNGIDENASNSSFEIFPNPSKGNSDIQYFSPDNGAVTIQLFSISGSLIAEKVFVKMEPDFHCMFSDIIPNPRDGAYVLKLNTDKQVVYKQFYVIH